MWATTTTPQTLLPTPPFSLPKHPPATTVQLRRHLTLAAGGLGHAVFSSIQPGPPTKPCPTIKAKPSKGNEIIKEQKWVDEGLITESLPNGMFWVRLDNEDLILGYVSGRIRRSSIRILPGDRVKVEISRYDSTRGRIIYRLRNKDSTD